MSQSASTCIRRAPNSAGSPLSLATLRLETWFLWNSSYKLARRFLDLSESLAKNNLVRLIIYCSDRFTAEILNAGVDKMNLNYGGKSPDVSRVIFTHGTFDGWTKVAAEQSFGPDAIVIMIEGGVFAIFFL